MITSNNLDDDDYWYESDLNKRKNQIFSDIEVTETNSQKPTSQYAANYSSASKTTNKATPTSTTTQTSNLKNDQANPMNFNFFTSSTIKQAQPIGVIGGVYDNNDDDRAKSARVTYRKDSDSQQPSQTRKYSTNNSTVNVERLETEKEIRLKAEISSHKAELQYVLEKREQAPDIKETIQRIITNKPFWFDLYKSKTEKIRLLDEAIQSCDGNAILAVVLFMRRTLLWNIFIDILISPSTTTNGQNVKYEIALNHYIYYLEQMNDFDELTLIYKKQGKYTEAAINGYKPLMAIKDDEAVKKIQFLDEFKENYTNTELSTLATKHIRLIDFQQKIERTTNGKISFKEIQRGNDGKSTANSSNKVLNVNSPLDTLFYCLKNYMYLPKGNHEYSLEKLKALFELNNKQYACVYIKAMAELYAWSDIERFTKQPTSLFNSVIKRNFDIPWECVASIIQTAKGPIEEVKKYVRLIQDSGMREHIAHKYKLHDIVIEEYKSQRNKQAIIQYRTRFNAGTSEYEICDQALRDETVKWR